MALTYGFQAEDIIKENRITREEIESARQWANGIREIPRLIDEQIVNFLLSCDRDFELAKRTMVAYYKSRKETPEFFNDRDLAREDSQLQLKAMLYAVLPKRTPDGSMVMFHKLQDYNYSNYQIFASMKILFMTIDVALYTYPPSGLIMLLDLEGMTLLHLTRFKIPALRAFFNYLQVGLPVKLKAVHMLNTVFFIGKIMLLFKPFIKPHIYKLMHFHNSNMNMEEFHVVHIPTECLPSNYGGDLPDIKTLHEQNIVKLKEMKPFFDAEERQRQTVSDIS